MYTSCPSSIGKRSHHAPRALPFADLVGSGLTTEISSGPLKPLPISLVWCCHIPGELLTAYAVYGRTGVMRLHRATNAPYSMACLFPGGASWDDDVRPSSLAPGVGTALDFLTPNWSNTNSTWRGSASSTITLRSSHETVSVAPRQIPALVCTWCLPANSPFIHFKSRGGPVLT